MAAVRALSASALTSPVAPLARSSSMTGSVAMPPIRPRRPPSRGVDSRAAEGVSVPRGRQNRTGVRTVAGVRRTHVRERWSTMTAPTLPGPTRRAGWIASAAPAVAAVPAAPLLGGGPAPSASRCCRCRRGGRCRGRSRLLADAGRWLGRAIRAVEPTDRYASPIWRHYVARPHCWRPRPVRVAGGTREMPGSCSPGSRPSSMNGRRTSRPARPNGRRPMLVSPGWSRPARPTNGAADVRLPGPDRRSAVLSRVAAAATSSAATLGAQQTVEQPVEHRRHLPCSGGRPAVDRHSRAFRLLDHRAVRQRGAEYQRPEQFA